MTRLDLVEESADIVQSLREFTVGVSSPRARILARQTTYWVYDPDQDAFGPGKFVGYRNMDFARYEEAVEGRSEGSAFNGHASRMAIEVAVGRGFETHEKLSSRLQGWALRVLGERIFAGIDSSKWKFLTLPGGLNYWAFLANPDTYRIEEAISELDEDLWTVPQAKVRINDRGLIWKAAGERGRSRGVIALAEVLSDPAPLKEALGLSRFWVKAQTIEPTRRVRIRYVHLPRLPLWLDQDKSGVLAELSVARATGGGVFRVEPHQWHGLLNLLGGWPGPAADTAL